MKGQRTGLPGLQIQMTTVTNDTSDKAGPCSNCDRFRLNPASPETVRHKVTIIKTEETVLRYCPECLQKILLMLTRATAK